MLSKLRTLAMLFAVAHGCVSCTAPKAPTVREATVATIAVVDQALAVAIDLDRDAGTDPSWERRVEIVENAAKVVKATDDVCKVLPDLTSVATEIKCQKCLDVLVDTEKLCR